MTGRLGSPFPAAWTTAQPDTASNNDSRAHGQCGRLHDLPSALLPDMLPFTPDSVSPSDAQLDALLLLILVRSLYKALLHLTTLYKGTGELLQNHRPCSNLNTASALHSWLGRRAGIASVLRAATLGRATAWLSPVIQCAVRSIHLSLEPGMPFAWIRRTGGPERPLAAGETVPDCAGAFLLAFACFCFRSPLQGTLSQQQQEQDPQRTAGVLGRRLPGRLAAIRPYTLCTEPQHATWSFWGPAGSAGAPAATVRRPPKRRAPPAASAAGHELHRQACSGHAEGVPAASTQQPRAL